jgi:hypothetical protein
MPVFEVKSGTVCQAQCVSPVALNGLAPNGRVRTRRGCHNRHFTQAWTSHAGVHTLAPIGRAITVPMKIAASIVDKVQGVRMWITPGTGQNYAKV